MDSLAVLPMRHAEAGEDTDLGSAASKLFVMHASPIIAAQNPIHSRFAALPSFSLDPGAESFLSSAAGMLCSLMTTPSAVKPATRPRSKSLTQLPSTETPTFQSRKRSESLTSQPSSKRRTRAMSDVGSVEPSPTDRVGAYSPVSRQRIVERFMEKRHRRIWRKRVKVCSCARAHPRDLTPCPRSTTCARTLPTRV